MVRLLRWHDVVADTPDAALHAALFAIERAGGYEISLHTHDFYEMLLIVEGTGMHTVNGTAGQIVQGDLLFLRAPDCHSIVVRPGAKLHWINIAFPADAWHDFRKATRLSDDWEQAPQPPGVRLERERLVTCRAQFDAALHRARLGAEPPNHLDLCGFLVNVLRYFNPPEIDNPPATLALANDAPPWLADACRAFAGSADALREGLPALRLGTCVSDAHLARVLKAATGQTPTEYINNLRLSRAAALLTTTAQPIIEIAAECGFTQLSYFYRLFKTRYGQAPNLYRRAARRSVGG